MIIKNAQPVVNNKIQILIKFLIVFLLSTIMVTAFFVYIFHGLADSITFRAMLKTVQQFSLITSIPTSILFVLVDLLLKKIKITWLLYLTRCAVFFGLTWFVSFVLSFYLIANALLDNPFAK